jgi:hypothetical protein
MRQFVGRDLDLTNPGQASPNLVPWAAKTN